MVKLYKDSANLYTHLIVVVISETRQFITSVFRQQTKEADKTSTHPLARGWRVPGTHGEGCVCVLVTVKIPLILVTVLDRQ